MSARVRESRERARVGEELRRAARGDFWAAKNYERLGRPTEARAAHASGVANLKAARAAEGRPARSGGLVTASEAESLSAGWLGTANEAREKARSGKTTEACVRLLRRAETADRKAQFWLDRANRLRGNS